MRKNNFLIYFLLLLVCISIGYAFLSASLTITGKSNIGKNTWDVHFKNIQIINGSVNASIEPVITNNTTIANFELILDKPGDFYEFTVDVENSGTIDAMIDSVLKTPDLTEDQKKYINYIIEYQNGVEILKNQLVKADEFVRIKVRVEYKKDLSSFDLPTDLETLNLGLDINYVQADESGIFVSGRGFTFVEGNLNEIGTIVTIGTEKFYVIGTEGDNVKLLSMYNLYSGNEVVEFNIDNEEAVMKPIDNPTGMQNSKAGLFYGETDIYGNYILNFPWYGVTAFSSEEKHGINYGDYTGSIIESYVNEYMSILENKFSVDILDARLITKEELTNPNTFACDDVNKTCINSPYSWIYSTTYWSGTAYDLNKVWEIDNDGAFVYIDSSIDFICGIRPVIVLPKSEIFGRDDMIEFVIHNDETTISTTYFAEKGMTWEEWVNSSYNSGFFRVINGSVLCDDGYVRYTMMDSGVSLSDVIEANHFYYITWMPGAPL